MSKAYRIVLHTPDFPSLGPSTPHELECSCSATRTDGEAPQELTNAPTIGWGWGAFFHEKDYLVDMFRAGEGDGS